MLRVALVGCGKVADQHVQAIHRIPGCDIVAFCDRELLMAKQLGDGSVFECFSDFSEMLSQCGRTLFILRLRLRAIFHLRNNVWNLGAMSISKSRSRSQPGSRISDRLGETPGLKITVGHNYQFTLEMLEMRRLVKEGFLGGRPSIWKAIGPMTWQT